MMAPVPVADKEMPAAPAAKLRLNCSRLGVHREEPQVDALRPSRRLQLTRGILFPGSGIPLPGNGIPLPGNKIPRRAILGNAKGSWDNGPAERRHQCRDPSNLSG